jgi:hypothetical protein
MSEEVDFIPASLMPICIEFVCPACHCRQEHSGDLKEDGSGDFRVPIEERFVECQECGQYLDIGWAGWGWHDAEKAKVSCT